MGLGPHPVERARSG
eukprot:gene21628-biopygen23646